MVFVERPEKPLLHLAQWGLANLTDGRRLANGIHGSLFTFMVMSGFTMWKNQVAVLGHFAWDQELASFEVFLHGGLLPQDILAIAFGFPAAAKAIDMAYLMWFPMLFASTFIMSFQPRQTFLRLRFMIAFALAWALGGHSYGQYLFFCRAGLLRAPQCGSGSLCGAHGTHPQPQRLGQA